MFKNIFNEWASRSNNVQKEDYDAKKDHNMNPTSHVKKEGDKFCVYNVKGEKVKSFDTEAEANAYAKKNHDALMKKEGMTKSADRKPETYRRPDGKMGTRMVPTDKEVVKMKEAMDAVDKNALKGKHKDRKDKDIDNDGDVDSSDKYLHKRRKAISKSMKKDKKEGDVEMNPKLDKGSKENSVEQKESTDESYTDVPKVGTSMKQKRKNAAHDKIMKHAKATATANVLKKMKSPEVRKESTIREKLLAVLENKQTKGATPPETMDDKLKGKGAKDMVNQPKEVDDTEEKGHDDASKAGKVTKPAKPRNGGDQVRSGDQKVVNPNKKVAEAYMEMKKKIVESEQKANEHDGASEHHFDASDHDDVPAAAKKHHGKAEEHHRNAAEHYRNGNNAKAKEHAAKAAHHSNEAMKHGHEVSKDAHNDTKHLHPKKPSSGASAAAKGIATIGVRGG